MGIPDNPPVIDPSANRKHPLLDSYLRALRPALWQSLRNDVLDTAKATAYSGMLMLFPAFLVLTTMLALVPAGNNLLDEVREASEQFLPEDTMALLQSSFQARHTFSLQLLLSAMALSLFAAWGVTSTLMSGFRRAYRLPRSPGKNGTINGAWSFWQQRTRALLLVPIALVPLSLATLLIVFGRLIESWMISNSDHGFHLFVLILWRLARWSLALLTSTTVLSAVYHFGTNSREHWKCVLPGAITATLIWFPFTLAFGVYVTRVADYSIIYGSLGTAIATLVWLYVTSFSVLLGAQLNGVLFRNRRKRSIQERKSNRIRTEAQSHVSAQVESEIDVPLPTSAPDRTPNSSTSFASAPGRKSASDPNTHRSDSKPFQAVP
jgi:membrane protein